MAPPRPKPYHHRRLRETVLEAAVAEIEAVGTARLSMREIARRAGVSHAAPAHHFGDKRGIFTAIATEGFALMRAQTAAYLDGPNALLLGGIAYVGFAATHPGHFEVMFRPDLYDTENIDLVAARDQAFAVLFQAVEQGLGPDQTDKLIGTSLAAWSVVHGFASLWQTGNLDPELTANPDALAALMVEGMIAMGRITETQITSGLPAMEAFGIAPDR